MNKAYELWKNEPSLNEELRKELESLSEEQLYDAFYKNLEFGTGGLRGILGVGTNRMNIYIVNKATLGFGRYLAGLGDDALARGVAISHDNRHQSKEFARIAPPAIPPATRPAVSKASFESKESS